MAKSSRSGGLCVHAWLVQSSSRNVFLRWSREHSCWKGVHGLSESHTSAPRICDSHNLLIDINEGKLQNGYCEVSRTPRYQHLSCRAAELSELQCIENIQCFPSTSHQNLNFCAVFTKIYRDLNDVKQGKKSFDAVITALASMLISWVRQENFNASSILNTWTR